MNRTAAFVTLLIAVAALGLAWRLPHLSRRPVHCDEAVHAYKFNELWQTGRYVYDLEEYHGPTLYYLTVPVAWLSRAQDWRQTTMAAYRIVPVILGTGLILLLLLVADGLGRPATLCAGLLTAVSTALVFYSRYYIQETLLVFFTMLVIAAGWRYVRSRHVGWALLAGAGVGLMHATKETCVIALGSMLLALAATVLWSRLIDRGGPRPRSGIKPLVVIGSILVAGFVSIVLFSAFFTNLAGPIDSIRAYATYFTRAGGGVHIHPWYYYLRLLLYTHYPAGPVWTEALIVGLSLIGLIAALRRRSVSGAPAGLLRFLAFYTILMTAVYSAILYKTPWCALSFLHGMILLAGVGAVVLVRWVRYRVLQVALAALLLAATVHLAHQSWRASHHRVFENDARNPYVYAHTVGDVVRLTSYVEQLARIRPPEHPLVIKVVVENCWPLPWYLRHFEYVGYWETVPDDPDADIVIASHKLADHLAPRLQSEYASSSYGLRPDETVIVYVNRGLRNAFEQRLRSRRPPTSP